MTVSLVASATDLAHRTTAWLATQPGDYDPSTGKGPDWGKAAPIGLLIILLLGVALFFLIRSMNKNLRRVPASFDAPADRPGSSGAADPAGGPADEATGAAEAIRSDPAADPAAPVVPAPDDSRPPR